MALALHASRPIEPDPALLDDREAELKRLEERLEQVEDKVGELDARFESYNAALALYETRIGSLEAFRTVASLIGSWKASTCIYREGRVCRLWRLTEEAAKQLADIVSREDGVPRVDVSKAPWFCALCPLYRQASRA